MFMWSLGPRLFGNALSGFRTGILRADRSQLELHKYCGHSAAWNLTSNPDVLQDRPPEVLAVHVRVWMPRACRGQGPRRGASNAFALSGSAQNAVALVAVLAVAAHGKGEGEDGICKKERLLRFRRIFTGLLAELAGTAQMCRMRNCLVSNSTTAPRHYLKDKGRCCLPRPPSVPLVRALWSIWWYLRSA